MSSNDEEYNLPLRHWLIAQVNSARYYGLEWNDGNCIKIPWIHQHHPGWEESYELFVAWAKHRGKYTDPPNYAVLKGNFRGAMSKSNDFEEISSQNNLQKGNYRLYKLLDREEAVTRKRLRMEGRKSKRKRKLESNKEKEEKSSTVREGYTIWNPSNGAPHVTPPISPMTPMKIIPPDSDVLLNSYRCHPEESTRSERSSASSSDGNHETITGGSWEMFQSKFMKDVNEWDKERKNSTSIYSPASTYTTAYSPYSAISDEVGVNYMDMYDEGGTSGTMIPSPQTATSSSSQLAYEQHQPDTTISKVLQTYNVSSATLPRFNMRLYYADKVVMERNIDLTARPYFSGYRLFFGDIEEQEKLFKESGKPEMLFYESISLPPCPPNKNKTINKLLDTFQQGITVQYDPVEAVLRCTRYCRSCVFFCGTDSVIELKRRECVPVFDYQSNLSKFLRLNKTSHMQSELVIGTKPHRNKLIKLKFRPILAMKLVPLNFSITSSTDLVSCCLDQPDSLDRQLEKMKL